MKSLSIILCTHNPRWEYLARALAALRAQTLPAAEWELVVIDNCSEEPLEGRLDLGWHPNARVVREEELGLTPARLRGVAESQGELLIFVDDDNLLKEDYLSVAKELASACPYLGAWGGTCEGVFEAEIPDWAGPYLCYLAVRNVERLVWSNEYRYDIVPTGAGMCVRRHVAEQYAGDTHRNPLRRELDRKGTSLVSGGDSDLAFTAIDAGLGIGLSPRLSLQHLMPAGRVDLSYLERLLEGISNSAQIVLYLHGVRVQAPRISRLQSWIEAYRMSRQPVAVRRLEGARRRGERKARALLAAQTSTPLVS